MRILIAACSAVLVLAFVATATGAESRSAKSGQGSDQAINVTAKKVVTRTVRDGGEIVFKDNVRVEQDDLKMTCDRLVVLYRQDKNSKGNTKRPKPRLGNFSDPGELNSITAKGHVRIVQKNRVVTSGTALYDRSKGTMTLTESPRLREGKDTLEADTIVIYLAGNGTGGSPGTEELKSISAVGHVKMSRKDRSATAGKAVYDHNKRNVTLTDSPRLRQGRNMLQAETIVFSLDDNGADLRGGIKAVINPGELKKEMGK